MSKCFFFQIFSTIIISGCCKVHQKYSELLTECFHLHINIIKDSVRNDLQLVENYVRNMPPIFTAAGFFQLNQGLYSSFCSAAVTYLIVIIQFTNVSVGSFDSNGSEHTVHVPKKNLTNFETP